MERERITITIPAKVLKKIDNTIDGQTIRNRSHAIENLLMKAINKSDVDTAFILAGGEGTRLRPITYEIPKPLIPIHGRPILEHQITMLKKYDIRNILLSVGYMHEKIKEYFGNGSRFGVKITYITEEKPLGTAGPLRLAEDYIKDTFVMLNVDTLMDPDIPRLCEFHKKQNMLATILLVTVDDTSQFGVVRMMGNQILEFVEKPKTSEAPSRLVNGGLYVFEPGVLDYIPKRKFMTEDLFKKLAADSQISGYSFDGKVYDVGDHARYEKAIKEWKDIGE